MVDVVGSRPMKRKKIFASNDNLYYTPVPNGGNERSLVMIIHFDSVMCQEMALLVKSNLRRNEAKSFRVLTGLQTFY